VNRQLTAVALTGWLISLIGTSLRLRHLAPVSPWLRAGATALPAAAGCTVLRKKDLPG